MLPATQNTQRKPIDNVKTQMNIHSSMEISFPARVHMSRHTLSSQFNPNGKNFGSSFAMASFAVQFKQLEHRGPKKVKGDQKTIRSRRDCLSRKARAAANCIINFT